MNLDAQLRSLAAQAVTRYPDEQARIDRGLVLALNGHVTLCDDGSAIVQSGSDSEVQYIVAHAHCDCPDYTRAPEGRCKHRFAVALVRKAQAKPAQRIAYHATFKGSHGVAIRDEQSHVWFLSDTDIMVELCNQDRPNLQLHGRMDIAAAQRHADLTNRVRA